MQLSLRALSRFLMHVPALNMDRRVRRIQPQGFFVQGCGVAKASFVPRGIGARNQVAEQLLARLDHASHMRQIGVTMPANLW